MLEESKNIADYIDIGFLQMLQDNYSKALGMGFVMVDYRGNPVTHYSGFTDYCQQGRKNQDFFEMCKQCDAHGGLQSVITGEPYIYRCHAGLVDFAIPLVCDGIYVGSLMGGQVRLSREEEGLECILSAKTDWHKDKKLSEAYGRTQLVSYEKVKSAVTLLRDMLLLLLQDGMNREQGAKKAAPAEKRKEGGQSAGGEFSLQKQELASIKRQGRLRYFFFVVHIISQLAFQEKATRTEAVAYDFADIMRYVTESDSSISTLGEELNYIGALLRIQKAWAGDGLLYEISAPDQYRDASCPYMVLEPLVELAVRGFESRRRKVEIFVEENPGGGILMRIVSDNEAMALEEMYARPEDDLQEENFTLRDSDRNLKRLFGKRCGLFIGPRRDGQEGHELCFRLPRKKKE